MAYGAVSAGGLLQRAQGQLARTLSEEPGNIAELERRRALTKFNLKRAEQEAELNAPALMQARMQKADLESPYTLGALIGEGRNSPNVVEHLFYEPSNMRGEAGKSLVERIGDEMNAYISPSEYGPVYKSRDDDRTLSKAEVSRYWPRIKAMYQTSMSVDRVLRSAKEELDSRKNQIPEAEYKAAKARLSSKDTPEAKIKVTQELIKIGEPFAATIPSVRSDIERHYRNIDKWENQIQKRLDREAKAAEAAKNRAATLKAAGIRARKTGQGPDEVKRKRNLVNDAMKQLGNNLGYGEDWFALEEKDRQTHASYLNLVGILSETGRYTGNPARLASDAERIDRSADQYATSEIARFNITEDEPDYNQLLRRLKEDFITQQFGGLPDATLHDGRIIFNPNTKVRMKSEGGKWVRIKESEKEEDYWWQ